MSEVVKNYDFCLSSYPSYKFVITNEDGYFTVSAILECVVQSIGFTPDVTSVPSFPKILKSAIRNLTKDLANAVGDAKGLCDKETIEHCLSFIDSARGGQ